MSALLQESTIEEDLPRIVGQGGSGLLGKWGLLGKAILLGCSAVISLKRRPGDSSAEKVGQLSSFGTRSGPLVGGWMRSVVRCSGRDASGSVPS